MDFWFPIVGSVILLPFVVGVVLDSLFGTWVRWWRWWFPNLLVGLAGVGFLIWSVVHPGDGGADPVPFWFALVFYALPGLILLPAVAAASGVGLRRGVARSAAKRPIGEIRAARK